MSPPSSNDRFSDRGPTNGNGNCPDRPKSAPCALTLLGVLLALWTVPLTLVGLFVGPHILAGAGATLLTAILCLFLAKRLSSGSISAWWASVLFVGIIICIQCVACYQMVCDKQDAGAVVFSISGIIYCVYILAALVNDKRAVFSSSKRG